MQATQWIVFYAICFLMHVTYLGHEPPHLLLGGVVTQGSQAAPAGQLFEDGELCSILPKAKKVKNLKMIMF